MRTNRLPLLIVPLVVAIFSGPAGAVEEDPTDLIDIPTAAMIPEASYDTGLRLYADGGMLLRIRVGLRESILFGFSFGGTNVIGTGEPEWNPRVEFLFKGLIIRESYLGPAVALGFDSQGYGAWDKESKRYARKSKGFYAVASKHFIFLGDIGFHGGVNYSLERDDGDKDLSGFFGIEKSIHSTLDLLIEYDLAINDNLDNGKHGDGSGYLNAALLWWLSENLSLEADFNNLLENGEGGVEGKDPNKWSRELKILYRSYF